MTTRKQGDHQPQGLTLGLQNGGSVNICNGKGILPGIIPAKSSRITGFDKDFPSLRVEESNGDRDVVRISSPGLCHAVQSLPVGNSALIAREGWTSALAEVPNVIEKTSAGSHANVGNSSTLMGPTGRNMAEALVQAPRTGTPHQGSVNTQRLEDRAIKQLRQLIPVVPSAPKGSGQNSSDKSKAKPVFRSGEIGLASSRNTQQQSSMLLGNLQSYPGSQIKADTTQKLVVLKPARENGVAAIKESGSPTGKTNSQAAASQLTSAPSTQVTASVRSSNRPRELKGASVNMIAGRTAEKRPFLAQTQSRNAFYRALKQNSSTNTSTDPSKTSSSIPASDSSSRQAAETDEIMERVEKVSEVTERNNGFESTARPNGKEAELLKSLGWDENNSEEDEALTEEEIRDFIEQCKKCKPSLVQKLPVI
ncbi:hypothetical protein AALP_AA6G202200 [Arabis alpina]|uniref:Uncharacterized protein n=1 Tax=Arabis alpina TaxID=50452 RepID=A0A087GQH8_ARAAL|nr:hypothetical protein AALP_AA6G202200 [Arabis alpina]